MMSMGKQTFWQILRAAFCLFLLAFGATQAAANPATARKLLAGDEAADDRFGASVAVDGDTAIIGAIQDDNWAGAAYVFTRRDGAWIQQARLIAADRAALDLFGMSVAVSGGTAVIGAWGNDARGIWSGAAYVFVRADNGTWSQKAKLTAADGSAGDFFGHSVAVSGGTAVIGAHADNDKGADAGSAYVFVQFADGRWIQQAKLTATDGSASDFFGYSVAVSGGTAVIGAYADDDKGIDSGSAYVFVQAADGKWNQQAKLIAADSVAADWFGGSVAVSGGTAVVGVQGDDDKGLYSGSAYVFVRAADGKWSQQAKLIAADSAAGDVFGGSVAVDGDTAVVVAWGDDDKGSVSGSAYVFARAASGVWGQQAKLAAADSVTGDVFGSSVAASGNVVLIGAWGDDDKGSNAGSAYIFDSRSSVNMVPIYKLLLLKKR
jgi:hypothetical protein